MTDVYLAVGHGVEPNGTYDPGAIGADGRQEHLEAFQICQYAWAALLRSGASTICEVAQGASHDPDYVGSALRANALGVRLAVEVHLDWRGGVPGFSGLYVSSAGQHLAELIGEAFALRHLPRERDVQRTDLYFLNATHMPALIPEINVTHDYGLDINTAQGEALAQGICRFLGRTYKPPTPPKPVEKHWDVTGGAGTVYGPYTAAEAKAKAAERIDFAQAAHKDDPTGSPDVVISATRHADPAP